MRNKKKEKVMRVEYFEQAKEGENNDEKEKKKGEEE